MRKRSLSILALVLAIVFTGYVIFSFWIVETATGSVFYDGQPGSSIVGFNDTAFGGLFETVHLNDSLPYYKYRPQADSIKNILDARERENNGDLMGGMTLGPLGVHYTTSPQLEQKRQRLFDQYNTWVGNIQMEANRKKAGTDNKDSLQMIGKQFDDSMAFYAQKHNHLLAALEKASADLHYFGITGYSLPKDTRFFMQNGTYNLAFVKWDSTSRDDHQSYGHYERKQIPVRYSTSQKRILIPVSKKLFNVLNTSATIIAFALVFLIVYIYLGLPLQILINISKGRAFDERNMRRFTIMWRVTLTGVLIYVGLPYLLWCGFRKMIPNDFILPSVWQLLGDCKWWLLLAIVLFLIGKAFQKGNSLQREQDLTI